MAQRDLFRSSPRPWNSGRIIEAKPPFKPKHVWAIRQQLKSAGRVRDLALFDCGIDAKLRGCDLVKLRVSDVAPGGSLRQRATVIQQKTGRPVPFEITDPTREALAAWLARRGRIADDWLFPSRSRPGDHIGTRQYARLVDRWVAMIDLEPRPRASSAWARTSPLQAGINVQFPAGRQGPHLARSRLLRLAARPADLVNVPVGIVIERPKHLQNVSLDRSLDRLGIAGSSFARPRALWNSARIIPAKPPFHPRLACKRPRPPAAKRTRIGWPVAAVANRLLTQCATFLHASKPTALGGGAMWAKLLVLVSCLVALAGPARSAMPPAASSIDAIARAALAGGVPGLSIGLAFRGETLLRAYGLSAQSPAVPVKPETIFHIASVSKHVLAAAVLRLAETGRVRLDDDIRAYVPEAPTGGLHVTVAELLNHTSGIPSFTAGPNAAANEALDLDHAAVLKLFAGRPFDFAPGTSWRYDNSGFYLGGMLVERVSGLRYAQYMRQQVFAPLGMSSTSMCDRRDSPPGLARGFTVRSGKLSDAPPMSWRLPFAAGGLCSTAEDLLKWEGALDAGRLIGHAMLSRMRQPTRLPDGTTVDYGFGTRIGSLQGHLVVGHTGTGGGYSAVLERFPADDLTIVVLANSEPAPVTEIAASIARAVLNLPAATVRDRPPPAGLVAAAAGLFDSDEGPIEQVACGARLCVGPPGHAGDGLSLKWQGGMEFALTPDERVRYLLRGGKVAWGELYSGGLMMDAKRRVR